MKRDKSKRKVHNLANRGADIWPCDLVLGLRTVYKAVSDGQGLVLVPQKKGA